MLTAIPHVSGGGAVRVQHHYYRHLTNCQSAKETSSQLNMNTPKFIRRLGPDPHKDGAQTYALHGCPDIWEIEGGDFAVIGTDITAETASALPATASCGPDERIIRIPRRTLLLAKRDIPNAS